MAWWDFAELGDKIVLVFPFWEQMPDLVRAFEDSGGILPVTNEVYSIRAIRYEGNRWCYFLLAEVNNEHLIHLREDNREPIFAAELFRPVDEVEIKARRGVMALFKQFCTEPIKEHV